jgi:hypothetical protein
MMTREQIKVGTQIAARMAELRRLAERAARDYERALAASGLPREHFRLRADTALNSGVEHAATAKDDAVEFLQRILAAGPLPVREIEREARDCGLLGETAQVGQCKPLRMARRALGVRVQKTGIMGSRFLEDRPCSRP